MVVKGLLFKFEQTKKHNKKNPKHTHTHTSFPSFCAFIHHKAGALNCRAVYLWIWCGVLILTCQ